MALYDGIGRSYRRTRRADPRIAAAITGALGDAATVVNVGAGAGASRAARDRARRRAEPGDARPAPGRGGPAVEAVAEALPLADDAVDAALVG